MEFRQSLPSSDVVFGKGKLGNIGKEASNLGQKALLVTGKSSMEKLGFLDKAMDSLRDAGMDVVHYGEVEPNPTVDLVDRGADLTLDRGCDTVIALGGGSSIDTAKSIAVVAGHSDGSRNKSIWDYAWSDEGETEPITDSTLPTIAVTSTAGTGSHVTQYAVVTNSESGAKVGYGDSPMFPSVSIVDPEVHASMPPGLTAVTGFDVFAHASESFICKSDQPLSDPLALKAMEYVGEYLPRLYEDEEDMEAREIMAVADTYAGFCIAWGDLALRHAMSHPVSGFYPEISHGQALASVAVPIMKHNIENGDEETWGRYGKIAVALGSIGSSEKTKDSALKAAEATEELLRKLDLDKSLTELGVKEGDLDKMVESTMVHMEHMLQANPAETEREHVKEIFLEAM